MSLILFVIVSMMMCFAFGWLKCFLCLLYRTSENVHIWFTGPNVQLMKITDMTHFTDKPSMFSERFLISIMQTWCMEWRHCYVSHTMTILCKTASVLWAMSYRPPLLSTHTRSVQFIWMCETFLCVCVYLSMCFN